MPTVPGTNHIHKGAESTASSVPGKLDILADADNPTLAVSVIAKKDGIIKPSRI